MPSPRQLPIIRSSEVYLDGSDGFLVKETNCVALVRSRSQQLLVTDHFFHVGFLLFVVVMSSEGDERWRH